MKKSVLFGIIGLAAGVVTSYGQGFVTLDNYSSGANTTPLTYGAGVPANGVSGALGSGAINTAWTVGLYFVGGTTGLSQAAGNGLPDPSLGLGTGNGSTQQMGGADTFGNAGFYASIPAFNSGSVANTTITLEIVVYPTVDGSYAAAGFRGHSAAFSMPTVSASSGSPSYTGDFMPGSFSVTPVPEPATLALAGLGGLASLVAFRRKQV
jgi:hypothetical protein